MSSPIPSDFMIAAVESRLWLHVWDLYDAYSEVGPFIRLTTTTTFKSFDENEDLELEISLMADMVMVRYRDIPNAFVGLIWEEISSAPFGEVKENIFHYMSRQIANYLLEGA